MAVGFRLRTTAAALAIWLAAPAGAAQDIVAFRDVSIVPMDREILLEHQSVIVRGPKIVALGPAGEIQIPRGAKIIDGSGAYLVPGLVDFHVHPNSPQELVSYVKFGVTTIAPFDGEALVWARRGIALPAIRPNLVSTTTILDGDPPTNRRRYVIGGPQDAAAILDYEAGQGAVMAKMYNAIQLPEFNALADAAHARGMPLVGHIPKIAPEVLFSGHGLDLVAHGEEFLNILPEDATDAQIDALAHLIADHNVYVNPDLVAVHQIAEMATDLPKVLADPKMAYMPSSMYQEWLPRSSSYANRPNLAAFVAQVGRRYDVQVRMIQRLHQLGASFVTGTDAPDTCLAGDCIHLELALLHGIGLSNYAALRTATANTGAFATAHIRSFADRTFGVVAVGADADLLLVKANPLQDLAALRQIAGVMVQGRWRSEAQLTAARDAALPALRLQHGYVDSYERLFGAGDIAGTVRFLDSIPPQAAPLFGDDAIPTDAVRLGLKGDYYAGILLLEHARRLMPDTLGVYHPLGRLMLRAGDLDGAKDVYTAALAIAPRDATAVKGLAEIACLQAAPGRSCPGP